MKPKSASLSVRADESKEPETTSVKQSGKEFPGPANFPVQNLGISNRNPFPLREKSDFNLGTWTRRIILANDVEDARLLHDHMEFTWHKNMHHTRQNYWTENHLFMYMISDYLLAEFLGKKEHALKLELRLLDLIQFKVDHGMAEFMSPTYMPKTVAVLLTLYDLSKNLELKDVTDQLLNRIALEMASLYIDPCYPCLYSPSGRSVGKPDDHTFYMMYAFLEYVLYKRRHRNTNVHLLEELNSTTWRPASWNSKIDFSQPMDRTFQVSPTTAQLEKFLDGIDDLEYRTAIRWSHGGYWNGSPHEFSKVFRKYKLYFNDPFNFHAFMPLHVALPILKNGMFNGFPLTDAKIHIYRTDRLIMASLVDYNVGKLQMQQIPWTVNCNSVPIFPNYDKPMKQLLPSIEHNQNFMKITYGKSDVLRMLGAKQEYFVDVVRNFDSNGTIEERGLEWTWGLKGNTGVGYAVKNVSETTIYILGFDGVHKQHFFELLRKDIRKNIQE